MTITVLIRASLCLRNFHQVSCQVGGDIDLFIVRRRRTSETDGGPLGMRMRCLVGCHGFLLCYLRYPSRMRGSTQASRMSEIRVPITVSMLNQRKKLPARYMSWVISA